uniref:Cilia and flagella associated protein 61 n=1 Tax=Leptobrachium leishanense TaxID=445787 RepID=A0A8C5N465_9ANUR
MTILTSVSGKTEVVTIRRAESMDVHNVSKLKTVCTDKVFGKVNITYLLEKANLAVTINNEKNSVIAHAAFVDYPNWDIVDQAEWEEWLHKEVDGSSNCTPMNTLFLHLFVSQDDYSLEIPALASTYEPMKMVPGTKIAEQYSVSVCYRHKHCPQLFVRKARVEDNDDLVPIFAQHNDSLKSIYGEYFVAELIEAQNEENHAIICEDKGSAVGFMSVCSEVNVKLLHDCFDLGPFHGLCKPHSDDILQPMGDPDNVLSRQASQRSSSALSQLSEVISVHDTDEKVNQSMCLSQTEMPCRASSSDDAIRGINCKSQETPHIVQENQPVYKGDVTAFCIQLFCIDEKYHLFHFVTFLTCTLSQELYIFHRAGLINSLEVRAAKSSDVPAVEKLMETLHLHKSILDDLDIYNQARRDAEGTAVQAFVAEVASQIVGLCILRNEEDIEYIRSHYNIEDFIYFNHYQRDEHGHLQHFALNPIFKHYSKHFVKEVLRLSHKSSLYYPVFPPWEESQFKNPCAHSLTSALHYMVPVRPRRQIVYPLEKLGINAPSKHVSKDQRGYALYHTNRKLTFEPKISMNARIVVVGASDVGISFLETLVFCPHLKFNSVTLISRHGLPGNTSPVSSSKCKFLASSHCYNDKDYTLMSLRSSVNVVVGKMTGIDRAAKFVMLSNDRKVPYDHLILCTGQQYQVPCPTGVDINKLLTNREVPDCCNQRYTGRIPSNLIILQDGEDCLKAMNWMEDSIAKNEGNVIVYGNTLDSYTTVSALLSLGISGGRIHLVQPPLTSSVSCFTNPVIEGVIQRAMAAAGVTSYYNCKLAQWNDGDHVEAIQSASFTTDTKPLKLQCSAFFSFAKKSVDYDAFQAISKACLVYDSELVIDSTFHTNDISIRAAGSLTKYSRRYYASEWTHNNFSSKEIGFQLAANMLHLFDPTLEEVMELPDDRDRLIPIFHGPKMQGGIVPGGYYYLHVAKPAIPCPLQAQMSQTNYGQELITGSTANGDYFRLHINQYSMVETITCLSLKPFPESNFICLYGHHERLLNNLCSRFQEGLIKDFYSYFMEPWCMAIYHDRFIDFKKELREILASKKPTMSQLIRDVVDDKLNLAEHPKKYLKRVLEENGYRKEMDKHILSYLSYNSNLLSMFARPGIV